MTVDPSPPLPADSSKIPDKDGIDENCAATKQKLSPFSIQKKAAINSIQQHVFWDTMPILKRHEQVEKQVNESIENKKVEDVRNEPYRLPDGYEWVVVDVTNAEELDEVYNLLRLHYVEDDDNLFRFDYSREFLCWALTPPQYFSEWHVGLRISTSKKLVAFITAIPATVRIYDKILEVAEVNFLCVHKILRQKRLSPVLIKEITRRVNLKDRWHAIYTTGTSLTYSFAKCRYWHRTLNPQKLVDTGFTTLSQRLTMSRAIRLFKVHEEPKISGIREILEKDISEVTVLLNNYLKKFKLATVYTEEDIRHWFLTREGAIYSYVREVNGKVTDLISFYEIPSTVIKNEKYDKILAAYSYYNVHTTVSLTELMTDALCLAKKRNFDVYNALDYMDNSEAFGNLRFAQGDGCLHYYFFNWKCPAMVPSELGLALL